MALLPLLFQNAIANCNAMLTHSINFQCYQARGKAGSQCYLSHVTNHGSNRGWFSGDDDFEVVEVLVVVVVGGGGVVVVGVVVVGGGVVGVVVVVVVVLSSRGCSSCSS